MRIRVSSREIVWWILPGAKHRAKSFRGNLRSLRRKIRSRAQTDVIAAAMVCLMVDLLKIYDGSTQAASSRLAYL